MEGWRGRGRREVGAKTRWRPGAKEDRGVRGEKTRVWVHWWCEQAVASPRETAVRQPKHAAKADAYLACSLLDNLLHLVVFFLLNLDVLV